MLRSAIAATIIVAVVLLSTPGIAVAAEGDTAKPGSYAAQKVVYHNNGRGPDSTKYFKALLKNLRNHVDAVGANGIDIKVVNHGDGVGLLQSAMTDADLAKAIEDLKAKGVQFLVCQNTLDERKIDPATLYGLTPSDIVPSGIAELIKWQQAGYYYVHP